MKKLFVTLLFMTSVLLLSAQSDTAKVLKYEYAFIYIDQTGPTFDLKIHYESGEDSILVHLHNNPLKNGKYNSIEWFEMLVKAFHHMERRGYEQMGSNRAVSEFGSYETPYFIFRRTKSIK